MKRLITTTLFLALSTVSFADDGNQSGEGTDREDRHISILCSMFDIGCQKGDSDGTGSKSNSDGTGNKGQGGTGSKGQGGTGGKGQGGTGGN